ncbi:MAG: ABC transporter permease [Clostridia bacterium]|nr:ABC transporter permease [Clostridia bacterium]
MNQTVTSEQGRNLFAPLSEDEKNNEFIAVESKTYLQDAWAHFRKNKLALISLYFLLFMLLLAIFVPIFSPYSYYEQDLTMTNVLPCAAHPLGTDKFGRDIFVRIMYGARISLAVGFAAAFINLFIGVIYGGVCGYFGGRLDMVLMRFADIIYSIPSMLYVIMVMLVFGSNIFSVLLAISVSGWIGMARQVRTQVLSLKEREYAQAARVMGAGHWRILFQHLISNSIGPILVNMTLMVPEAIFTEAFLAFVGIGISIPQSSWGSMANEARSLLQSHPIQMLWPVLAISLTLLSLNCIGDGLNEALDPRKR